jgi:hypothetical protein
MSGTPADRALVSRWFGTAYDEPAFDEAIERLGSAYGVAIEFLSQRLATLAGEAVSTRAGGRASDHSKNIEATEAQIAKLVGYVTAQGISLNGATQALFDEAAGNSSAATVFFSTSTTNRRAAG